MFIVLEGCDGTGKSTLAQRLADDLGGVAYSTPPKKYRKFREQVDAVASPIEHYKFYKDAVFDASLEIREMLEAKKIIVCDRYWISTITYHQVMGLNIAHSDFSGIVMPDLTVMLTISSEIQIKRLLHRGLSTGDKRMLDQQNVIRQKLFDNLLSSNTAFLALDTGKFNPEQCSKIVSSAIYC